MQFPSLSSQATAFLLQTNTALNMLLSNMPMYSVYLCVPVYNLINMNVC